MKRFLKGMLALAIFAVVFSTCEHEQEGNPALQKMDMPDTQTIYSFLNTALSDTANNKVLDRNIELFGLTRSDSMQLRKLDTLFSDDDIAYVYRQLEDAAIFRLNPQYLDANVVSGDEAAEWRTHGPDFFWKSFRSKYGDGACYTTVAKPLFTIDKSVVIFKSSASCGFGSSVSLTTVYKKRKGKWMKILTLGGAIS